MKKKIELFPLIHLELLRGCGIAISVVINSVVFRTDRTVHSVVISQIRKSFIFVVLALDGMGLGIGPECLALNLEILDYFDENFHGVLLDARNHTLTIHPI